MYNSDTSAREMKCGGHVGRAHANALKELKSKTEECDSGYIVKHKNQFPAVEEVACNCEGKRHPKNCGCFNDGFIESVQHNLFCAITHYGNASGVFQQPIGDLGRYHTHGIHSWDDGECDFHPLRVCSYGKRERDELECLGKEYQSSNVLTCPLHALACEI